MKQILITAALLTATLSVSAQVERIDTTTITIQGVKHQVEVKQDGKQTVINYIDSEIKKEDFETEFVKKIYDSKNKLNNSDSVIVIKNPNEVIITDGRGYINIEVRGKENNDDYNYSIRKGYSYGRNASVMSEKNKDWEFSIPFINKRNNTKAVSTSHYLHYRKAKFQSHLLSDLQFGIGLVGATGQASGMDIEMANGGFEFFLNNLFSWEYARTRNTSLSLGFGVDWRNYRMNGRTRFIKNNNEIILGAYPDGADIRFSRLQVFSLTLDLMLRQRLYGNIYLNAGPVVNFNTSGTLKTRYTTLEGEGRRERYRNIHQRGVTVDFKGELKIEPIAFYIKYSPMNMLKTEYGPKFRSLSAGAMICF